MLPSCFTSTSYFGTLNERHMRLVICFGKKLDC